jgi:dolichyl-phosphate-mannose-protein mannosyltransferase
MTNLGPISVVRSEPTPLTQQEKILLALSVFVALLVHWHFRFSGFGEQDAARLASDAIHWHETREIFMAKVDYRLRTSPLYIHTLKLALDHRLPIRALPALMNGASVVLSSACLIGLYLLFRRLSGPAVAAAATCMYALTPCFWLGSVYGMPTLPALTFWVFGTLAFARATDEPDWQKPQFVGFMALALVLASIAFALKADMALSGGALLTILIFYRRLTPKLLACAGGIVVIAFAFALIYAKRLAAPVADVVDPNSPDTLRGFFNSWSSRFPFRWSLLVDPKNNAPITHACGTLLFALIVIALVHGLISGGTRARMALALAIWGLTPLLFWGLKPGNSARHNLPAFAPLVLVAAAFLFELVNFKTARAWLLLGVLGALGWLDTSGTNSVTPKANVFDTTRIVEGSTSALHQRAREFASSPGAQKAIIESEYLIDYSEFEIWAAAKHPSPRARPRAILDGPDRETRVYEVGGVREARAIAQRLRSDGWEVFSVQFSL